MSAGWLLAPLALALWATAAASVGVSRNVPPLQATKPPTYLIEKYGYQSEVHTVQTEDGYLLRLDRIPQPGRPAILLGHALLTSACVFLANGPRSLGFALYDAGYDVWLANFRGNGFSLNHVRLDTSDPRFWQFSFHEHGALDLPALIDYVLFKTRQSSLLYLGYSMGSTTFFVGMSVRPEYNRKVRAAFLMAPVVFLAHQSFFLIDYFRATANSSMITAATTGVERFQFLGPELQVLVRTLCVGGPKNPLNFCNFAAQAFAAIGKNFTDDILPTIPTSMSVGEGIHYGQLADPSWPGFRMRSFGKHMNRKLYGQDIPPDYPLGQISVPSYLYIGKTDSTTHPKDVASLVAEVSSVRKVFYVPKDTFDHVDFSLNKDAPEVYKTIIEDIRRYA